LKMSETNAKSRKSASSLEGFKIRWCKKAALSQDQKQAVKKDLTDLFDKIIAVMNDTKEENTRKELGEVRLRLPSIPRLKAYLTVEYCNDAWHIFMETYANCIGEIFRKDGPFIQMLDEDEVEEEETL
jgi:hypothetical protein